MVAAKKRECAVLAHRVQMLPVDRLVPTPENGRRPISANSLKSLARSIKKNGVLQPVLVRVHPTEEGKWEIRAGFRRWRAAKLAGLARIPALVGKLDDETALSVTITENLQRENLHPLEEAAVIQKGLDAGFDIEAVASRLGKNPQFVARRSSLTRLIEPWRKAVLAADTLANRLSPAHLELIARLPEETQQLLAEDDFFSVFGRGFPSVDDLRRIIEGGLHTLGAMAWSLDDETLDPQAGSCRNCPKRSGAQPLLFDGEEVAKNGKPGKTDRCLDPACFDRKQVAHVQRCELELRVAHPNLQLVQIGHGTVSEGAREAFGERCQRLYAPTFVKAASRNAIPVMQIDGPKAGKLVYIDDGGVRVSAATGGRAASQTVGEKKPLSMEERSSRHFKRRQAFVVKQVEARLRNMTVEDVAAALSRDTATASADEGALEIVSLLLAFGTSGRSDRQFGDDPWDRYDRLRQSAADVRVAQSVHEVLQIWVRRLVVQNNNRIEFQAAEARRMCEILGIDFAAIETEAVQVLPEPKSWRTSPEPRGGTGGTESATAPTMPKTEPDSAGPVAPTDEEFASEGESEAPSAVDPSAPDEAASVRVARRRKRPRPGKQVRSGRRRKQVA